VTDINEPESDSNRDKRRYRSENWLREQYWGEGRTAVDMADEVDVKVQTICKWMGKHDIERRDQSEAQTDGNIQQLKNVQWLREQYWEKERTTAEIAEKLGLSGTTVRKYMRRYDIERRGMSEARTDGNAERLQNERWLREQYWEKGHTLAEIAQKLSVSSGAVRNSMERHDIERRGESKAQTDGNVERLQNEQWLREQYCDEERTSYDIAAELGVSDTTVREQMEEYGIDRRDVSVEGLDEERLREQYYNKGLTGYEIAEKLGVTPPAVYNRMEAYGMERRSMSEIQTDGNIQPLESEQWVREQYCKKGYTTAEIAEKLGVSDNTVCCRMDRHDIKRRNRSEAQTNGNIQLVKNEQWMREQYCEQGKTTYEIADELSLSRTTVTKWLDVHEIERKSSVMDPDHLPHRVIGELELNIANCLRDSGIDYKYESLEVEYGENRTYIPDFATESYVIECKGRDWGKVYNKEVTDEQKAEAIMRQLDDREYVVVGIQLPCDIHIPREEHGTIQELFE
jgi:DNA-binding CsgD family transcriptional regulator